MTTVARTKQASSFAIATFALMLLPFSVSADATTEKSMQLAELNQRVEALEQKFVESEAPESHMSTRGMDEDAWNLYPQN